MRIANYDSRPPTLKEAKKRETARIAAEVAREKHNATIREIQTRKELKAAETAMEADLNKAPLEYDQSAIDLMTRLGYPVPNYQKL